MILVNLLREPRTNSWLASYMEKQAKALLEGAAILRATAERNRTQYEFKRHRVMWPNQKPLRTGA